MYPKIIGVCGPKGSGKTLIGEYLRDKYGYLTYAFGGPLKNILKELFLLTDDQLNTDLKEEIDPYWNIKPRELLQKIGTEVCREEMPKHVKCVIPDKIWVQRFERWYNNMNENEYLPERTPVIVTDVRFPEECESIKKLGGVLWYIKRDIAECQVNRDSHKSEVFAVDILNIADLVILNNGTKKELYEYIDNMLN
tara:strand:- start:1696 stop:2280 length:585 start_codon:yes stop_codon:yes gene_type:complete